jgi:hypothetical protein
MKWQYLEHFVRNNLYLNIANVVVKNMLLYTGLHLQMFISCYELIMWNSMKQVLCVCLWSQSIF